MNDKPCDHILDYINDQLSDIERKQFEKHLSECPRCQEELKELEDLMGDLPSYMEQTEPPSGMKQRVLDEVFSNEEEDNTPVRTKRPVKWKAWSGVLAAGLLLSIGMNVYTGLEVSDLASENEQLESSLTEIQTALSELEDSESGTASPLQQTELASAEGTNAAGTATLLNRETKQELLVQTQNLENLEPGEVYQVWLIEGETPEPAGAFTTNDTGSGGVAFTINEEKSWDAVAITKEPQTGNQTPQGDIILQAGL
ncbi:hypothetical protein GLW04_07040 [Halobacillus litoralis]|uniref:Anti-sigma-W factor RsiW n=1 Tax=Halobacillus litoralis TaxID=45668 RepID=A0A845DQ64_9BACI|nr:anti-sigma factor [Halobacillus litoralis]MYL19640.1 hypothetical protein [Halobacillus litoralis]MYL37036.1 hypothetical protein [Halobacillus litoralis]